MTALAKTDPASDITSAADGLLNVIANAARDPNVDVDKMERLFGLQERLLARDAEVAFSRAMANAKAEMPQVLRESSNETTRSTYTKLDKLSARIDPVIVKHGFSLSFGTAESHLDGHYRVTCRVRHVGGFHEDHFADVPSDTVGMKGNQNKTATHGFGSTMSYGRRYLKLMIFDIATTDDDGQAAMTGELIALTELEELKRRVAATGANENLLAANLKVPALSMLPASRFREAMAKVEARAQQRAMQEQQA